MYSKARPVCVCSNCSNRCSPFFADQFAATGREAMTLAIGCTGGRHRSVALVEHLGGVLHRQGHVVQRRHRDIDKD